MRIILLLMAVMLMAGAEARYSPGLEIAEGENITLDGGFIYNFQSDNISNVRSYGAVGDGETDDTAALQDTLNQSGFILIPAGEYMLDISQVYEDEYPFFPGLSVKNDSIIYFMPGASIKNLEHNESTYGMLTINEKENVTIVNPTLDGNRTGNGDAYADSPGAAGFGIYICESRNVTILGGHVSEVWGDGITTECRTNATWHCQNVIIDGTVVYHARRNGISIQDADGVVLRDTCCELTNGTAPEDGIDLEPWHDAAKMQNIVLDHVTTRNNRIGIAFVPYHMADSNNPYQVEVISPYDEGSYFSRATDPTAGLYFGNSQANTTGSVRILDPVCVDSDLAGIAMRNWNTTAPRVDVFRPVVLNPNRKNTTLDASAAIYWWTGTGTDQGNIYLWNPYINSVGYYPKDTISWRGPGKNTNNGIIDPLYLGTSQDGSSDIIWNSGGIFTDKFRAATYPLANKDTSLSIYYYHRIFDNSLYTTTRTVTLADFAPGTEITFEVVAAQIIRIDPAAGDSIKPTGSGAGKYIYSNTIGSKIGLKKYDADTWIVSEIVGTWAAE